VSDTTIRSLRAFTFRAPISRPVVTSFGTMRDRPMVLVRAEDADGAVGWGEIWCNFPNVGAEHRARLVDNVFAPLLEGKRIKSAAQAFAELMEATAVLAIQAAEPGPIAQCIAGIDIALWDLMARRAGEPLWRLLGGASPVVPVYASGLNPGDAEQLAVARREEGYRAFKLKVGFGVERDVANLRGLRTALGPDAMLMVDANQAWTPEAALSTVPLLEPFGPCWIEEPIRADCDWAEWQGLARQLSTPLAAGENLAGEAAFAAAIESGAIGVLQPDIGKWGGFTSCLPVARRAIASGLRYCPHWLGGGIGLLASAHLLAAAGGDGLLEVDANDNPLRTLCCGPVNNVSAGKITLTNEPGLGPPTDLESLGPFLVRHD
jgi:L-alanine-DL-glutamate epimerase-like enolase superfamily enzyme